MGDGIWLLQPAGGESIISGANRREIHPAAVRGILQSRHRATYIYELADQGPDPVREQNFGLLRYDMTEKPAYSAVKNLIDLLEEPGANFTPTSLAFTLTAPSTVHNTLLQKSDGRYLMLLWNEVLSYDSVNKVDLNPADVSARWRVWCVRRSPIVSAGRIGERAGDVYERQYAQSQCAGSGAGGGAGGRSRAASR